MAVQHLGVNYANIREALEQISVSYELPTSALLDSSAKNLADETLFLELARRGYDLSSLLEKDEP